MRKLYVGLLAMLLMAVALPSAVATEGNRGRGCFGLQGHGETAFDVEVGAFVGVAEMRLGGQTEIVPVTVYADPVTWTSSHVFEFQRGTIVTHEPIVAVPTDDPFVMELLSRPVVVDGGSGRMHLLPGSTLILADIGVGEPVPVAASWDVRGVVCFDESAG